MVKKFVIVRVGYVQSCVVEAGAHVRCPATPLPPPDGLLSLGSFGGMTRWFTPATSIATPLLGFHRKGGGGHRRNRVDRIFGVGEIRERSQKGQGHSEGVEEA